MIDQLEFSLLLALSESHHVLCHIEEGAGVVPTHRVVGGLGDLGGQSKLLHQLWRRVSLVEGLVLHPAIPSALGYFFSSPIFSPLHMPELLSPATLAASQRCVPTAPVASALSSAPACPHLRAQLGRTHFTCPGGQGTFGMNLQRG